MTLTQFENELVLMSVCWRRSISNLLLFISLQVVQFKVISLFVVAAVNWQISTGSGEVLSVNAKSEKLLSPNTFAVNTCVAALYVS